MWISTFSNSCSISSNISSFNIILFHELFAICLQFFSAIVCITKMWHCWPLSASVSQSIYHSLLAEYVTLKCLFSLLQLVYDVCDVNAYTSLSTASVTLFATLSITLVPAVVFVLNTVLLLENIYILIYKKLYI